MSTSAAKAGYHHGDLRSALIEAALSILEEGGGTSSLTLREAARRAGVSAMAPYRHFADKDALLAAVATVGFVRLRSALDTADARDDTQEALIGQGVAYVAFACANPALFRLMFGAASVRKEGALCEAADAAFAVLSRRLATAVPAAQVEAWSLRNWATVHGLAALAVDGQLDVRGETPAALTRRILTLPKA